MQHDPNVNHSNKDIEKSLTKYNVHGVIAHKDKILKQHYGQFIAEHDAKQKRSDRKYGSIAAYLEKQHGQPEITAVATFGSKELLKSFNDQLYQETLRNKTLKAICHGLILTVIYWPLMRMDLRSTHKALTSVTHTSP